jgi:chromosomal replication initiation ATPase DnaA
MKSDERILGDGDFVAKVLSQGQEFLDRHYHLLAKGVDIDYIAQRVARVLDMPQADIWLPGKQQRLVKARSLLCYWAVRELGLSMAAMARRLNISTVAVSKSVERGRRMSKEKGYRLI